MPSAGEFTWYNYLSAYAGSILLHDFESDQAIVNENDAADFDIVNQVRVVDIDGANLL